MAEKTKARLEGALIQDGELLTDPYIIWTGESRLLVSWVTEFQGDESYVLLGDAPALDGATPPVPSKASVAVLRADTVPVEALAEDAESETRRSDLKPNENRGLVERPVWRHTGMLPVDASGFYKVVTINGGIPISSRPFRIWEPPACGEGVNLLLTSDHQVSPLAAAGMTVAAQQGPFDAVLMAGDLVSMPNRGTDWFDNVNGSSFFPVMQGLGAARLGETLWTGGEILQQTPLIAVPGNHEFSGGLRHGALIGETFNETQPHESLRFINDEDPGLRRKVPNESRVFDQLLSVTEESQSWHAVTVGNTRIICLCAAMIWRPGASQTRPTRYEERSQTVDDPAQWGYGQHILGFGLTSDSPQYQWLLSELASDSYKAATFRIVVLHHPIRHLAATLRVEREDGNADNEALPFANPTVDVDRDHDGTVKGISYRYESKDQLLENVEPLLGNANVDLIINGHSHIWNRFQSPYGPLILECSNSGGTRLDEILEATPISTSNNGECRGRILVEDQTGLPAEFPTVEPIVNGVGAAVPYLASPKISVFSTLNTNSGVLTSYYISPLTSPVQVRPVVFDVVPLMKAKER